MFINVYNTLELFILLKLMIKKLFKIFYHI